MVLKQFHKHLKVFVKTVSEQILTHKPWDHAINLKPEFELKKAKVTPLSLKEQEEVDTFIKDQLEKGYICESKSPQTSALFFVPKKNMKSNLGKTTDC